MNAKEEEDASPYAASTTTTGTVVANENKTSKAQKESDGINDDVTDEKIVGMRRPRRIRRVDAVFVVILVAQTVFFLVMMFFFVKKRRVLFIYSKGEQGRVFHM